MLVTLAGTLIAILPVLVAYAIWRMLRAAWRLVRGPRRRLAIVAARLGRLGRLGRLTLRRRRAPSVSTGPDAVALADEVARLKAELRLARAELAVAEAANDRPGMRLPWRRPVDDRFHQAKLAFARAFHPDRLAEDEADRAIRVAIFRDFWEVLRRIERG